MVFNSFSFLIFFIFILVILRITNSKTIRKIELLLASYIFYGFWDWRFLGLLIGVSIVAYVCGAKILRKKKCKFWLKAGIILPLLVLGIFKYFNFFVNSFCSVFQITNSAAINIILPVGISFYTFQAISYVVDAYRSEQNHDTFKYQDCTLLDVLLYIAFFPQLVAGPIVKAKDFLPQLKEDRQVSIKGLEIGIQIFLLGLFKKIVIADHIAIFVDEVYRMPDIFNSKTILLAILAYSVQIYCDFSGYSDMAIGCAKCMGYDLQKNFDLPYLSQNVSEFWHRWHISLSTWLKEYLYIPLGGNRKGKSRTYINLFVTMTLGGIWHGANWTFVIWGMLHGLALCIHKFYISIRKGKEHKKNKLSQICCMVINFFFVSALWIFFRADSLSQVESILRGLVRMNGVSHIFSWAIFGLVFIIMEGLIDTYKKKKNRSIYLNLSKVSGLTLFLIAVGLTISLAYVGENPFIYFQF